MKGNKFLAAVLAASMAFSAMPATAASVFADTFAAEASMANEETDASNLTAANKYMITDDEGNAPAASTNLTNLKAALEMIATDSDATYSGMTKSDFETMLAANAVVVQAGDVIAVGDFSTSATTLKWTSATTVAPNYGKLTFSIDYKANGQAAETYYVTLVENSVAATDVAKLLADATASYCATYGSFDDDDIKTVDLKAAAQTGENYAWNAVKGHITGQSGAVGTDDKVTAVTATKNSETNATATTAGSLTGTVSITYHYMPESATTAVDDTKTADFTATKNLKSNILDGTVLTNVVSAVHSNKFDNDVTADQVESYIENLYINKTTKAVAETYVKNDTDTRLSDLGISATATILSPVTKAKHGEAGSASASIILTATNVAAQSGTATLVLHQPYSEVLDEAEANIATAAETLNTKLAKKETKSDYTAVTKAQALADAQKVLTNAWSAKVKDTDVALSFDAKFAAANPADEDEYLVRFVPPVPASITDNTFNGYVYYDANDEATSTQANVASIKVKNADETETEIATAASSGTSIKLTKDAFKSFTFTAPTTEKAGSAVVTYTAVVRDGDKTDGNGNGTLTKDITFTINYPKVTASEAKSIELGNEKTIVLDTESSGAAKKTTKTWTDLGGIKVAPAGVNDITFTSSDPSVATADAEGVTAYKAGIVTITATSSKGLTDSVKVTVVDKNYPFADVADSEKYFFQPVYWAKNNKITAGTSATTFSPDAPVTRAQFVTWLYAAAKTPNVELTTKFSDVSADDYYAKAVAWAVSEGITAGTGATTFNPNGVITRAQAATMLYRATGSEKATTRKYFSDVPETAYYYDAVNWAYAHNVTSGTSDTTFSPNNTCTRAQAVTFLYRAY